MNCQTFAEMTNFHCTPILTRNGDQGTFVALESTFMDGTPLSMYTIPSGNRVLLTDGGDTLFHLHSVGFRLLTNRRRWASLREAVAAFGASLNDSGEIEIWAFPGELRGSVERFIAALLATAHWEEEHFGLPLGGSALIDEVREYLIAKRPQAKVRDDVEVEGLSGRIYTFPLSIDGVLIHAMSASWQSSNSMVRRLVDIRAKPSWQNAEIEIAVDDRKGDRRSEEDIRLIELLATPLRMSELRQIALRDSALH